MRVLGTVIVSVMLFWLAAGVAQADGTIDIAPDSVIVDLSVHGTRVAAQRRNLQLEVPGEQDNARAIMELRGQGPGPDFNWTLLTLRNAGPEKRDFILAVDAQRLTASGIVRLAPFGSQLESAQWLGGNVEIQQQVSATADAWRFELLPGQSTTVGLQGPAVLKGTRLYDAHAFSQREASLAFLRGAALAVGLVLSLGILALYGMRTHRMFLVAGFFGFACMLWMSLEAGFLPASPFRFLQFEFTSQHLRATVESLFALACGLLFWGATGLRRRSWLAETPYMLLIAGLLASVGLAAFYPDYATKVSRWAVLALAVAGFLAAEYYRQKRLGTVDNGSLFWACFLAYIFLAAVAVVAESDSPAWHAVLLAGLTTVLGLLAFVCLRLAFAQGFLSTPYLKDQARRSLALSGAQHFLWDWQPFEGVLDVGVELARSLGHDTQNLTSRAAVRWFAALLHPSDELAYRKSMDMRQHKPGSYVEQELRLRDAQGQYHWFVLRARTMPGPGGMPSRLIGTLTDITRNKANEDRLITEAIQDPVTGLPTRALFLDRVEREVAKPLALPRRILLVALERFKILNEGLGPDLGDQLLLAAGQRIAECMHDDESAARVSGSRFSVVHVESIDGRSFEQLAEEIVERLTAPINIMGQDVYLSACIGISGSSANFPSASVLQQQAEQALRSAQAMGPRSIDVFHEDMVDDRADKLALETDLRRAIERHEIEVHYQPVVNLLTREVAGLEALARWRHPQRGLLQPADFIGLAEQAGMIRDVGDLVLAESIRQMGIWQRVLTRNRPVFVAVNVSADQLSDTGFLDRLNALIAREGVLPAAVKIEITESVVMRYPERARQLVQRLRSIGLGVACDDFGTGFSNLASLRDLAFDTLKIDRSFITGDVLQGRGGVILQSVVDMAHSLGMAIVAEGVETEEQAQHLLMLGCEMGQGYALGHPMLPRDVHNILAVLPVVAPTTALPDRPAMAPAIGTAPMAPRTPANEYDDLDIFEDEEVEPEVLPSLFDVYAPPKKKKPTAKRKKLVTSKKPAKKAAKPKKAAGKARRR